MSEYRERIAFSETPVKAFKSASLNNDPLLYPGERPPTSFITDGELVSPLFAEVKESQLNFKVASVGQEINLDEYLRAHDAPTMENRIPVISFGSNMCPGSLLSKFTKVGRPDALVVPTIYTELPGHDVVWSRGPGINGNFIAILYDGPQAAETSVQIGLSFLTREQLLVLHATEMNYIFQKMAVKISNIDVPAYFYSGRDNVFTEEGNPIAVSSIPAKGRILEAASTTDMLQKILSGNIVKEIFQQLGLEMPEADTTPQQYVGYLAQLEQLNLKKPKAQLKELIHTALEQAGKSQEVRRVGGDVVSWANPSTLQTYGEWLDGSNKDGTSLHLPNQELPPEQWSDKAARDKVLRSIATHFHRHWPYN